MPNLNGSGTIPCQIASDFLILAWHTGFEKPTYWLETYTMDSFAENMKVIEFCRELAYALRRLNNKSSIPQIDELPIAIPIASDSGEDYSIKNTTTEVEIG